jgi:hypothetical protein
MLTLKVKYGRVFEGLIEKMVNYENATLDKIDQVVKGAHQVSLDKIKSSIKRDNSGKLENNWTTWVEQSEKLDEVTKLRDGKVTFCIGDIDMLNQNVINTDASDQRTYWKSINDGGYIPPITRGAFNDSVGAPSRGVAQTARFIQGTPGYKLEPKKTVEGIKFIETAVAYIDAGLSV